MNYIEFAIISVMNKVAKFLTYAVSNFDLGNPNILPYINGHLNTNGMNYGFRSCRGIGHNLVSLLVSVQISFKKFVNGKFSTTPALPYPKVALKCRKKQEIQNN